MPIPQLGVFLDNRPGSMSEVMSYLDKSRIKIFALSIVDAGEFGLARMVVEDAGKAARILEDADFNLAKSRKNTEVTAILISEKDKISEISKVLGDNGMNIEYAYSSAVSVDGKFALVLRIKDIEKAERTLKENGVVILSLDEIKHHFQ